MRLLAAAALLTSALAVADVLPAEVASCRGKAAGAACATSDGAPGTCQEISVTRPDYSGGVPPTYKTVKLLGCVATAKAQARVPATAWLGGALAFFALAAGLATRRKATLSPRPA